MAGRTQGLAGAHRLQTHGRGDVPRPHLADLLAVVGVHLEQTPDALLALLHRVVDRVPGLQHARIRAEERERPHVGVGRDLEGQGRERRIIRRGPGGFLAVLQHTFYGRHLVGGRHVVDDRIEQRLNALVLERGAAQRGHDLVVEGPHAQSAPDVGGFQIAGLEVLFHQLLVGLRRRLHHALPGGYAYVPKLRRNLPRRIGHPQRLVVPVDGLHADEIDDSLKLVLGTHGQLHGHRIAFQAAPDLLHHAREIGAGAVHLVHEREPRHAVAAGLAPDRLRLRLHAAHGAENRNRAVQHAKAALNLDGEVYVPGRVDDVDAVLVVLLVHAAPETGGRSRGDGDTPLLLLDHPVHDGRTVVDLPHLVGDPGVVKNTLRGGRFAGVDVRGDPDVPVALDWRFAWHCQKPLQLERLRICFPTFTITNGSAKTPCSLPPYGGYLRAS